MRTMSYVLAVVSVITTFAVAGEARVEAQSRGRFIAQAPFVVGAGSTIGVSVRDSDSGVLIEDVRRDSPAARAGLMKGDVVTEFDGERARSAVQFTRLVRETPPGRSVKIAVTRDGSGRTFDIAPDGRGTDDLTPPNIARDVERGLRRLPRDFEFDFEFTPGSTWFGPPRLGTAVIPLSDQLAQHFGVKQGVLVSEVAAGSAAEGAGIKAGDIILAVGGRTVASPEDLSREVRQADAGSNLEVRVMRDRKEMTLTAKIPERTERRRPFVRGVRAV